MEINHKITIPKPCHENWDKMTPNENGRFCMSCSKTVIYFTTMLPEEIQQFFIQNKNQKVCGRFKNSQLETITIQIPNHILYSQTHYHKIFLLALFIAMGTTLFSCADKEGKKKKIEKIEVTKTTPTESIMVGEPAIDENDTIHNVVPPPPPPKVDAVKFVDPKKTEKSVCVKSEKTKSKKKTAIKEPIYINGEVASYVNAEFPGGIDQFYTFFSKEFKTPEDQYLKNSKIKISFAVEKDGSMSYIQSEPAIDKSLEQEIIRVLKACPKWQAGLLDGKKTKMQYSLPIAF